MIISIKVNENEDVSLSFLGRFGNNTKKTFLATHGRVT